MAARDSDDGLRPADPKSGGATSEPTWKVAPEGYEDYPELKGWAEWGSAGNECADYYEKELASIVSSGDAVLEIGFGGGDLMDWLRARGCRVVGIEIQPDLVNRALTEGFEARLGPVERFTTEFAKRFDAVIGMDVLEHMDRSCVADFLKSSAAMLKFGGVLILRFPNGQSPFGRIHQYGDATHRSVLSLGALQQEINQAGLAVQYYGGPAEDPGRGLKRRVWRFVRRTLRGVVYLVCGFCFDRTIPWSPNVVLVLRRTGSGVSEC